MRYMTSFHRRLRVLRESRQLSVADIARLCDADERRVAGWESENPKTRTFPDIDELMDLCLKTETPLEALLDFEDAPDAGQLELPGLAFDSNADLGRVLEELEREIERLKPTEEEMEMLRRFRNTTAENRRMVIQLLG
ncbi:XRE family transcriptional regulator [Marinobacter sp. R17]|uniref:helix-turn-helix domain-containing protein n=2 Tax=Marinobacteraceae TaxID=2887365 RepID=UPI000F4BDF12|nr:MULTISPECIES: helix-turn-helix transcriptional regulator [Marinobacter]ROT99610.1 XRE family transcriptional regulator [Marinobacter sp. R17]